MSIVAAAVVPHSPLLLPSIAKKHFGLFDQTITSIQTLAADWYAAKPDAVIVLSPHGIQKEHQLVIHSADRYLGGFSDFGDISTQVKAIGAVGIMHQIQSMAERSHLVLHLQTYPQLDYGTSVPMSFIVPSQPNLPLCSILIGLNPTDSLVRLSAVLREFLVSDKRRYLVLASCDLTRREDRSPDSLRRPSAEERIFSSAIVSIDPAKIAALIPQTATCGYSPLLVLLGTLSGLAHHGMVTSFSAPLGVGLLTASFAFSP